MTFTLTSSRLPSLDRPLEKLAMAALTEPPIRNSGSGVRAAPPMMLITFPWEAFSSGQNSLLAHAAEELERIAFEPDRIGQVHERSGARRARVVDQHVAARKSFIDARKQLLAGRQRTQVAGHGEGLRSQPSNRLGGDREILGR